MSQPLAYPPSPRPSGAVQTAAQRGRGAVRSGIRFAAGYVLVIWAVHLINVLAFGGYLVLAIVMAVVNKITGLHHHLDENNDQEGDC